MTDREEWSEWFEHSGGEIPVHPQAWVQVQFRDLPPEGAFNPWADGGTAGLMAWHHDGGPDDIVAFRFLRPRNVSQLREMSVPYLPEAAPV